MFEPGLVLRISLQRFGQFATGRIRRGGRDSVILDTKIPSSNDSQSDFYFEKRFRFHFV
jgi:hypothetical protein